MKRGFEMGGKYSQDPIGSERARGKSTFRRKSGRDPGLTPSELHQKGELMRQFMVNPEGPGGNSTAYQESAVWCRACNGRRMNAPELATCEPCSASYPTADITQEQWDASQARADDLVRTDR